MLKNKVRLHVEKEFSEMDTVVEHSSKEHREQSYESWRKQIEHIVETMKNCTSRSILSRRDLLAKGLIASSACVLLPRSIIENGYAQQSMSTVGVLQLEAAGGPFWCDFVPAGQNGIGMASTAILNAYGARPTDTANTYKDFAGLKWFASSPMMTTIEGILGNNLAAIGANTLMIPGSAIRPDDSGQAEISGLGLWGAALGSGVSTSVIQASTGYRETHTNPVSPLSVASAADAAKLPGAEPVGFMYTNKFQNQSVQANSIVLQTIKALSNRGISVSKYLADDLKTLISSNAASMAKKYTEPSPFQADPTKAADANMLAQAFPNAAAGGVSAQEMQSAQAVVHCLTNVTGGIGATVGRIRQGGHDSHNGQSSGWINGQIRLGQIIARSLLVAFNRRAQFAISFDADGSQFKNGTDPDGAFQNVGDDGSRSTSMLIIYNPAGRPSLVDSNAYALSGYNSVTGSGRPVPDNVSVVADAATTKEVHVLNVLASFGMLGRWEKVSGTKLSIASAKAMNLIKVKS